MAWTLPAHTDSQHQSKKAHLSSFLQFSHPVKWMRRVTFIHININVFLSLALSHEHIQMLTIVSEWTSPMGAQPLSFKTQSWAENFAGTKEARYKNLPCLPGPIYASHEDMSVKERERGSQMKTYHSCKQSLFSCLTHLPGRGKRYDGCLVEKTAKMRNKNVKCETRHISVNAHLAYSHLHAHLRVFVHGRCVIYLLRRHSGCQRKFYSF